MPQQLFSRVCVILCCCLAGSDARGQSQSPSGSQHSTVVGSLRLRVDRADGDVFRAANEAITEQRYADALRLLLQLPDEALIPVESGAIARAEAIARLLRLLPNQRTQALTASGNMEAELAWAEWLQHPAGEGLQDFCRLHGTTRQGVRGWITLALRLRDDQRWQLSRAAWNEVLRHPGTTVADRNLAEAAVKSDPTQRQASESTGQHFSEDALRPAADPVWFQPLTLTKNLAAGRHNFEQHLRAYGHVVWPAAEPVSINDRLFLRTLSGVTGYEAGTGAELWQVAFEDWGMYESPALLNPEAGKLARLSLQDLLSRRLAADTVLSRLTHDRTRLLVVQPGREKFQQPPTTSPFPVPVINGRMENPEPFNFLAAYEQATGKLLWRIGGRSMGPTYAFADMFFCGPPLVLDDLLFTIAQHGSELMLLALRADTGELQWKLVLGDVSRSLNADPARQRTACTPVWHAGLIFCPTVAGAIVAVDPLTRSIRWAQRYGLTIQTSPQAARGENSGSLPDPWWDSWREAAIVAREDRICLVSPESDELHAFAVRDGARLWTAPRAAGLRIDRHAEAGLIVQEKQAVRLHDWATGHVTWQQETGEISGNGCVVQDLFFAPTQRRGITVVSLTDGRMTRDDLPQHGPAGSVPGNLMRTPHGWLTHSLEAVAAWNDMASSEGARTANALSMNPSARNTLSGDESTETGDAQSLATARQLLGQGKIAAALDDLAGLNSAAANQVRLWCWIADVRRHPAHWRQRLEQISELQSATTQQAEFREVAIAAAVKSGASDEAAGLVLAELTQAGRSETLLLEDATRAVRLDRAFAGWLADLMSQPSAPGPESDNAPVSAVSGTQIVEPSAVEQQVRAAWVEAAAGDPFALPRLSEALKPLEIGDELLQGTAQKPFLGQAHLAVELRLLKASGHRRPEIAARLQEQLLQYLRTAGFAREADDYAQFFQANRTADDSSLSSGSTTPRPATSRSSVPWSSTPELERTRVRNDHIHYFPVPFDAASSPWFDRLDVQIERQGRRLRLGGGGHAGTWEIELPPSPSQYRYLQQYVAAWGRGRVIVLRVGFELFGIAPVDDRGEPAASILWHLDMLNGAIISPDRLRIEVVAAARGRHDEEYRIIDSFGQTVGDVGPVRADYVCYREQGRLICIDLWTGMRNWARNDLPADCVLWGDDRHVYLQEPALQQLTWLRTVDGKTIGQRPFAWSARQIVHENGGRVCFESLQDSRRWLICEDLETGRRVWELPLSPEAVVCLLDEQHAGILSKDGELRCLSFATGEERVRTHLHNLPPIIDRLVVARDHDRWYLAISERVPQQAMLKLAQLRNGYRLPFITGVLAAVDRHSGQCLWQRAMEREPFAWDQPKSPPVLLQLYRNPQAEGMIGPLAEGVVRLLDKQTGTVVFEQRGSNVASYAALSADAPNALVTLALEHETIRLSWRPRPPAPELPVWE